MLDVIPADQHGPAAGVDHESVDQLQSLATFAAQPDPRHEAETAGSPNAAADQGENEDQGSKGLEKSQDIHQEATSFP